MADTEYEAVEKAHAYAKHVKNGGAVEDESWYDMITPALRARLLSYRQKLHMCDGRYVATGLDVAMDLDHNPARGKVAMESRGRPSQLFTFISHGCIWHESHQRPLLCTEFLLGHGVVPSEKLQMEYGIPEPVDFWDMLQHGSLSASNIRSCAGNMWHIPTFGMYIMYILSQIESKAQHQTLTFMIEPGKRAAGR